MYSKNVVDTFSRQVEQLYDEMDFDHYTEAIEWIIENNIYDFITYSNAGKFINKSLKEKLLIEYTERNMINKDMVEEKKPKKKLF